MRSRSRRIEISELVTSMSASRPDFAIKTGFEDTLCDSDIQRRLIRIPFRRFRYPSFAETVLLECMCRSKPNVFVRSDT